MPEMNSARVTGEDKLESDLKFKMDEDEELAKLLRPDNVQENVAEDLELEKLLKNDQVREHSWDSSDDQLKRSSKHHLLGKKTFF